MVNILVFTGRLTADIELKSSASGKSYAHFTLACDRDRKDADGNRQTDFIKVTAFGNTAEFAEKYFHKGDLMQVSGRLESSKYTDGDGNNRTDWGCTAEHVWFCGAKTKNRDDDGNPISKPQEEYEEISIDDDLPF